VGVLGCGGVRFQGIDLRYAIIFSPTRISPGVRVHVCVCVCVCERERV